MAYSHSQFYMTEANVKGADYVIPIMDRGLRLGLGYVNANFNNDAWAALSGTFRASNVSGGTTVSLPTSVLTAPTGGNLTLYSGGGTGFTDGVSNGGHGHSQPVVLHAPGHHPQRVQRRPAGARGRSAGIPPLGLRLSR